MLSEEEYRKIMWGTQAFWDTIKIERLLTPEFYDELFKDFYLALESKDEDRIKKEGIACTNKQIQLIKDYIRKGEYLNG